MHSYLKYILIICFIEGSSVMAVELIGAKMIAPWFGTSLYVWTSVLGVTMIALAAGYYLGGYFSHKQKNANGIKLLLIFASLSILVMPMTGQSIMNLTQMMDVRWGSMISAFIFIMPPLLLMGMISPMIIHYCTNGPGHSGKVAGSVFALSTLGGVLSVLLTGFYLLPYAGIYDSTWIFAGLMFSANIVIYAVEKHKIEWNLAT